MARSTGSSAAALALLALALAAPSSRADDEPLVRLRSAGHLGEAEWRSVERGEVVAKVIDTEDRSEILSFAAARVKASAAVVAAELRDREGHAGEPWTLQSGAVGTPATVADFAALALDPGDVKDLSRGRVNDCDVRLPNDAILGLRRELDGVPEAARGARASAAFRQLLASYAAGYQSRGNPALFQYENNGDPVRIADSLEQVLRRSTPLWELAPDLFAFARTFPAGQPPDAEQQVYWMKEKFWLLDVLSLDQLMLVTRNQGGVPLTVVVSKQLYATHYYESSLGVTVFVESRPGDGWLFFVNRTRADIRRSGFSWVERLLVHHLVGRRLGARTRHLRARLERPAS
ncbi:MAG TPA: hypothetical protein VEQ10_01950 [Vicinamibacteria bacterium]|nr:hypothetical protein [Vicinamibacteria bacterium]